MQRAARMLPILLIITLTGCTVFGGAPKGAPNLDVRYLLPPEVVIALDQPTLPPQTGSGTFPTSAPVQTILPVCVKAYGDGKDGTTDHVPTQMDRDNCVVALMAMVDKQYDEFRDGLLKLVDDSDLVTDVAILGLGSATTLVPGKTTKSILGAISAGFAGTKAAINSDILYNTSIVIIINQMDTDRATQRCTITTELKNGMPSTATATTPSTPTTLTLMTSTTVNSANAKTPAPQATTTLKGVNPAPPQTYSMYDASADLVQYYMAGTFTHALQALEAKTGSQATESKQQANNAKTGVTASSTTTTTSTAGANKGTSTAALTNTTTPTTSTCSS
jgi:hypothetical protein